jgi:hypothetical protein
MIYNLKLFLVAIVFTLALSSRVSFASESQALVDGLNSIFNSFVKYSSDQRDIEKSKPEPAVERKLSDPYYGKKVIVVHVPVPNGGGATIPKYIFVDDDSVE